MDDIFCKIANQIKKENIVMEGEDWLAINDIHPQAPVHILVLPKKHLTDFNEVTERDESLLGRLLLAAVAVSKKVGLDRTGYRIVINCGEDGGQIVPHLHIHILGGKKLGPKIVLNF